MDHETAHSEPLPGVSANVLEWARNSAGFSIDAVAQALKKTPEEIEAWERGIHAPTYAQLEVLAYKLYKRPLAAFFLPEPPEETPLQKEFRTLPGTEIDNLLPDTRRAIREVRSRQYYLHELTDSKNPSSDPLFSQALPTGLDVEELAKTTRSRLKITLMDQLTWRSSDQAFEAWRLAIERAGIFVFKRSFEQRDISGFCLLDDTFPVICVNNSTPRNRQIFTLFHEVCHVLLHTSGICKVDDSYISVLRGERRHIEVLCNEFAGVFLVPGDDLLDRVADRVINDSLIDALSRTYKASRSVVVRRLYELRAVSKGFYEQKEATYSAEYLRHRDKHSDGGNYYSTQVSYLGRTYIELVLRGRQRKRFTSQQLAEFLGVRAKNLEGLEQAAIANLGRA